MSQRAQVARAIKTLADDINALPAPNPDLLPLNLTQHGAGSDTASDTAAGLYSI
jgi:hypothetical protein